MRSAKFTLMVAAEDGDNYRSVDAYKASTSLPTSKPTSTTITDSTTDVGNGWSLVRPSSSSRQVTIGSGSTTNSQLPFNAYYNYSLTQQIFTASEIAHTGKIKSLSFNNTGSSVTRTLNIYLVNTTKSSFSSGTDWIAVTNSDLVFSGSVTFASGEWTTITLTAQFPYSGNNLAVIIDDNTASYTSQVPFASFEASGQAIRIYSDSTNYDPTSPSSYSGTVLSVKNQLKIEVANELEGDIYVSSAKFKNGTIFPTGTAADWSDPVKWNGDDGNDAVTYEIVFSAAWAKRDKNGHVTGVLAGNAYKIEGSTRTALNGATIEYGYTSGGNALTTTNSQGYFTSDDWFDDDWDDGGDYCNQSYSIYASIYISGNVVRTQYVNIAFDGEDGIGQRGKTGRFYYYAGEYSDEGDYEMEETQAPFVKYGDSFWMLDFKGIEPSTLPASSTDDPGVNSESWTLMSSEQQYYIAKAVFGDYAQFGGFCINGDWHISTYGKILNTPYNTSNWDNPSVFTGTNTNDKATAYLTFDPSVMPSGVKKLYGKKDINGTSYTSISISPSNGMRIIRVTGKALGTATLYLRISHGSYTRELTITGDTKSVFFVFNVNGSVTLQAKMSVSNTTGTIFYVDQVSFVPEYAVDGKTGRNYSHDISLTGSLSAKNVLRNVLFYWYENDGHLYYYSKNVYYISGTNDWVETSGYSVGMYVMEDEVSNDSGFDTTNLVYNTYDADVVVCMFGYADATVGTFVGPTLPRPEDFLGKMVEIYSSMYSGTGKMRIYVVGEGCLCRKIYRDGSCEMYGPFAYLDVTVGVPVKAISVKVNNKYRWLILEQFISAYGGESASFNPNNKTSLTFQNGLFQSAT